MDQSIDRAGLRNTQDARDAYFREREIVNLAVQLDRIEQAWNKLPPVKPGLYFYMAQILIDAGVIQ